MTLARVLPSEASCLMKGQREPSGLSALLPPTREGHTHVLPQQTTTRHHVGSSCEKQSLAVGFQNLVFSFNWIQLQPFPVPALILKLANPIEGNPELL